MKIAFSPMRRDVRLDASVSGDVLTINGEDFDFAGVPEGATLPASAIASEWFAGPVERIDGKINLTLILPHGDNAPVETRFPDPVTVVSGGVPVPAYEIEAEEEPVE